MPLIKGQNLALSAPVRVCCYLKLSFDQEGSRTPMSTLHCMQAKWQVSKHIRSRYFNNLDATEAYIKGISHLHDTYLIRVGHPLCAESKQPPCGLYS